MSFNPTSRQVLMQLDVDPATGVVTVPDTCALTVTDDEEHYERTRPSHYERMHPGLEHEDCKLDENFVRVRLNRKRTLVLNLIDQSISPESFDKLSEFVKKMSYTNFLTLVDAIKCVSGFELHLKRLISVDDRNSAFDMLGRFHFKFSNGVVNVMDFHIQDYHNFEKDWEETSYERRRELKRQMSCNNKDNEKIEEIEARFNRIFEAMVSNRNYAIMAMRTNNGYLGDKESLVIIDMKVTSTVP